MTFGSNTEPRKFGRGKDIQKDWKCICGTENKKFYTRCSMCNVEKKVTDEVNANS